MPIDLKILSRQIAPERTILLFGAGSSIPSGGLSAAQLAEKISTYFGMPYDPSLQLGEVAAIVEKNRSRKELVGYLRSLIMPLVPTGGLMNLPLFDWRSIYTTNYDQLIENVYGKKGRGVDIYTCNFDFSAKASSSGTKLYKIHGSIDRDISDGNNSRMIVTVGDYDNAYQYRELLFDTLRLQMTEGDLLIVGHSLADPDIRPIVDEVVRRKRDAGAPGKIYLLMHVCDENRAMLFEERGLTVCFGGLDDLFGELSYGLPPQQLVLSVSDDPLDVAPALRAGTVDVAHAIASGQADAVRMFNGSACSYADIAREMTFEREVAQQIEAQFAASGKRVAYVLGVAGVGKTSAVRQSLFRLSQRGLRCWEHKDDFSFSDDLWIKVHQELVKRKQVGVLLVDDCHNHMREVSRLIDVLVSEDELGLKIVLCSTKHHWNTRVKTPTVFSHGCGYTISRLTSNEINSLLDLLEGQVDIRKLIEDKFLGFSRPERRRRLEDRCGADMFVCMKNIFGFEPIDNIILREYADLPGSYQDIYRTVAAMEASGVRVHRQLVIRTLGIAAQAIAGILENLTGIIDEDTIKKADGLYSWRCRHNLIASIISKYKFADQDELYALFDNIVRNLIPTYGIEIRTIRDMCDIKAGIGRISDLSKRNYLLRRMISLAPGERVPRHRLISNLIEQGQYEECENEIRLFEKELRLDAPVHRYKIKVIIARAINTDGIMDEDRVALVSQAADLARNGIRAFPDDKGSYSIFLEVGLKHLKLTGKWNLFDEALSKARDGEERVMDPELRRIISAYEQMSAKFLLGDG